MYQPNTKTTNAHKPTVPYFISLIQFCHRLEKGRVASYLTPHIFSNSTFNTTYQATSLLCLSITSSWLSTAPRTPFYSSQFCQAVKSTEHFPLPSLPRHRRAKKRKASSIISSIGSLARKKMMNLPNTTSRVTLISCMKMKTTSKVSMKLKQKQTGLHMCLPSKYLPWNPCLSIFPPKSIRLCRCSTAILLAADRIPSRGQLATFQLHDLQPRLHWTPNLLLQRRVQLTILPTQPHKKLPLGGVTWVRTSRGSVWMVC